MTTNEAVRGRVPPAGARAEAKPPPQSELDALVDDFEEFGLKGYQARALLAVLRLGSAPAAQVARLSGVPRTSVYPVLEDLRTLDLVRLVPGKVALWVSLGEEEVLRRLHAVQEQRFRSLERRLEHARERLAAIGPVDGSLDPPHLQIIHTTAQALAALFELLQDATHEALMVARPAWSTGAPHTQVLDAIRRGVSVRGLWETATVVPAGCELVRNELQAYLDAGADFRLAERVPVEMAIVDRRWVVFALTRNVDTEAGDPPALLIDHPGYAEFHADAFEVRWAQADPWQPVLGGEASGSPSLRKVAGRRRKPAERPIASAVE